ncbi:hypothetical protein NDU88_002984 [Pleurodeles waltl]|uniref:Uncharacterized protein n=1 Tax=Pleurodeles waltl TaxID=8319 RepID=A0AAV7TM72_PLEWA|nr:hypothetical protein NDU88_002984 [Pleurodeles waltl]
MPSGHLLFAAVGERSGLPKSCLGLVQVSLQCAERAWCLPRGVASPRRGGPPAVASVVSGPVGSCCRGAPQIKAVPCSLVWFSCCVFPHNGESNALSVPVAKPCGVASPRRGGPPAVASVLPVPVLEGRFPAVGAASGFPKTWPGQG